MNGGPSGFHNSSVTKAFVVACTLFTVIFGIQGRSSTLGLSYQDVFGKFHLWRFLASRFAFSSTPELMFGLYLLYYFRVFERQIGSNKYSVFILFSMIVSLLYEVLLLFLVKDPSKVLASGPYGLIFSSFVPFFFDIPVSTRFRIFGIHFSDKSFIYLAGIQLLLSSWKRSILPGLGGILAGVLYHMNLFGFRRMKFPEFVTSFFSRLPWPSAGGSSPTASSGNIIANMPSYTGRPVEGNYPSVPLASTTMEPPEDSIATLVSMGFDRHAARQALVRARNDINNASNILLEAQGH
ncbi:rhomboid-like protein 20 [Macadamia integrifolia]|uniref:rhomboid-like protein 20 n=1 Tax=Macadamia integrifolia TaxID=60698 RepID=UPI001C4EC0CE|nr:rhomboid-like protein 20 [Macadamia integrifolia]